MSDDLQAMRIELARDPASLVFIPLGEALRSRGQLEAARRVVLTGLERNPDSVEAHDLHARVLVDAGDAATAEREWKVVLALDGRHLGARKGLGFICYRRGDLDGALDHLELALSIDPTDQHVIQALHMVRSATMEAASATTDDESPFGDLGGSDSGILLVDPRGRVLAGSVMDQSGVNVSEAVAAQLAGASQEAERAARILDLGEWSSISAESADGNLFLCPPSQEIVLLLVRETSVPLGRLEMIAQKAAERAKTWIETQRQ